jgi:hypothetical protein
MSIELLTRAAKAAHDESNRMHYQYNDQSWGRAPEDVFNATLNQYRRKTRQYFLFDKEVRRRKAKAAQS